MGDRANVFVKQGQRENGEAEGVWLYTHSKGGSLPCTLQTALAREERWNDDAYLARIIFCEMVRGHEDEETGFGISTSICDNEYLVLVVDPQKQTVGVSQDPEKLGDKPFPQLTNEVSFKAYVAMTEQQALDFRDLKPLKR